MTIFFTAGKNNRYRELVTKRQKCILCELIHRNRLVHTFLNRWEKKTRKPFSTLIWSRIDHQFRYGAQKGIAFAIVAQIQLGVVDFLHQQRIQLIPQGCQQLRHLIRLKICLVFFKLSNKKVRFYLLRITNKFDPAIIQLNNKTTSV